MLSGPSGIRTHDLLNAIETRSQLRYGPLSIEAGFYRSLKIMSTTSRQRHRPEIPVGRPGFKPETLFPGLAT